jgi:hypothetical protein
MLPERPNYDDYIMLVDALADEKDNLSNMEYLYDKKVATNLRSAMNRGAKTRELDVVKVLGNNAIEEKEVDQLMAQIFDSKKKVAILYGKINVWMAKKELYRTDMYHQVGGFGAPYGERTEEN